MNKKGYTTPSQSAPGPATGPTEETDEMRKGIQAFLACMALMPVSICEAAATPAPKPLPPLVAEAPPAASEDMWTQYPEFFARFKEVWLNCPRELEYGRIIEGAKWFNDNTAYYERIIRECRADRAHKPNRSWPPTQAAAKMRIERFFSRRCDGAACRWVRTK